MWYIRNGVKFLQETPVTQWGHLTTAKSFKSYDEAHRNKTSREDIAMYDASAYAFQHKLDNCVCGVS